ncbi:hypothetical protein Tco_0328134 [Tanacetum coccineum]
MANYLKGLEVGSIRRIQGIGYGILEFLGVKTTFDIFQNIHMLYIQYDVLVFTGYGVLNRFPLWSLVSAGTSSTKMTYDKNAALGICHWGPKRQLYSRSRNAAKSLHEVFSHMQILGVVRLTIDNQFRYGYLKEIVIRRADLKEYSFK